MGQQDAIASYKNQLSTRFYSNSMSLEVLVCLILIFLLVIELIKFAKKTYEWQADNEMRIEQRFAEDSRSVLRERERNQMEGVEEQAGEGGRSKGEGVRGKGSGREQVGKRGQRQKKDVFVPAVIQVEQVIRNKLPQIIIIGVNVVSIASYEYCAIVSYIAIVIIVIAELIGSEHVRLKLGLELISKLLLITLYVNVFTVAKPSP